MGNRYMRMRDRYVRMRDRYVRMRDRYVRMRDRYVRMIDNVAADPSLGFKISKKLILISCKFSEEKMW